MSERFLVLGALIALACALSFAGGTPPARAAEADPAISCAVCGKQIKKSKAIRVIQDGHTYYVCSEECVVKLKKKKK
jgi:YHS domain-containing protein